jgi:type I restriction enzyme, S subunit
MIKHKDWPLVPLKKITLKIGSGATPRGGKNSYKASGISLIRSLNVYDFIFDYDGLAFIDDTQAEGLSNVEVERNDILLNITGASVARCCIVPDKVLPARVNQHVSIVRTDPNLANPYYVLNVINSPMYKHHLLTIAQGGATREALTKEKIENFKIPLPPITIQKKIAGILSAYDDLIENNTRRIKILEEMAQLIYRQWFVEYKFPGHEGVRMVDSGTELGEVPEGWEVVSVSDLYDTGSGGTPSRKIPEYYGGEIKWIKTRELNDRHILDTEEKITESGLRKSSAKIFPKNTVIMAMYGATIGKLGILTSPMTTNQACCAFLSKRNPFTNAFIFLNMLINREKITTLGMGAAQQNISQEVIRGLELIKPNVDTVQEFNEIVEPMLESIRVLQQKNDNLRTTRDLILPKLVSGEVEVSEVEVEAVHEL